MQQYEQDEREAQEEHDEWLRDDDDYRRRHDEYLRQMAERQREEEFQRQRQQTASPVHSDASDERHFAAVCEKQDQDALSYAWVESTSESESLHAVIDRRD